jgi:hypothetical protein
MARLDWDRLRRTRALDGADVRVDADGARLWERKADEAALPFGTRRLRRGVIVRRRQQRANAGAAQATSAQASPSTDVAASTESSGPSSARPLRAGPIRCPRCGARVSPRKLLRHARRCPRTTQAD